MNWRTYANRPAGVEPVFEQAGPLFGRLHTQTAIYTMSWAGGKYRLFREPVGARTADEFEEVCRFDQARYPDLVPSLMWEWTPTEWLYFLEGVLPLEKLV
jgi:hypothetical protein